MQGYYCAENPQVVVFYNKFAPVAGLHAEYYNDTKLEQLVLTRTDPQINFEWKTSAIPAPGMNRDHYSVRWTGQVLTPASGNYTFTTISDDGVRLWINGKLIIDNWRDHTSETNNSEPILLQANQLYDLKLEFYNSIAEGLIRLLWAYPGQELQLIPSNALLPHR